MDTQEALNLAKAWYKLHEIESEKLIQTLALLLMRSKDNKLKERMKKDLGIITLQ